MNSIELKEELDSILEDVCNNKYFIENIEGNIIFSDKQTGKVQFNFNDLKKLNCENSVICDEKLDLLKEISDFYIKEKGSVILCKNEERRHNGFIFSDYEYLETYVNCDKINLENCTFHFLPKGVDAYKISINSSTVEDEGSDNINRYFYYYKANEVGGHEVESMTERECKKALKTAKKEFQSEGHIYIEF